MEWILSCDILYMCIGALLVLAAILAVMLVKAKKGSVNSQNDVPVDDIDVEEKKLLGKIENGLANGEFKMYLQFIVENKSGRVSSAEALSRWEPADGEVVFPAKYIGVMAKYGKISMLDYSMFELACKKLESWKNTEFSHCSISCNFTRITISENAFVKKIKAVAEKYDFDREKLIIEITEDSIEKNLDTAKENILTAKELGFTIALDDVGSGYTSLVNLCEYPIDVVKLDRDILLLANAKRGQRLFRGLVSLAHYLSLKVVCEGVENVEQNALVFDSDCDYIQGWHYFKAMPEVNAEAAASEYAQKLRA